MNESVVFSTPWFELVQKAGDGDTQPYYSIRTNDYVSIVALTKASDLILVRQHRPAVNGPTLELPSGHVETGLSPEQAARAELWEETGYVAGTVEPLGCFFPDTGRLSNRMWCFFTKAAVLDEKNPGCEPDIEVKLFNGSVQDLMTLPEFSSALSSAAVFLAVLKGKLRV